MSNVAKQPRRSLAAAAPLALALLLGLAGCATGPSSADLDRQAQAVMLASFRDQGIAKAERVRQDAAQAECSHERPPPEAVAERLMADAKATVKWPAGGQYFGDWREGERIAQDGRGMTWTDASAEPGRNGGSCYNCHQISAQEVSFGTIGPSLHRYGRNRGVQDVTAPTSASVVQYTWTKLYNAKSYAACSNMPRFGHLRLLSEEQMRHLMSLLLDPRSPVNQ